MNYVVDMLRFESLHKKALAIASNNKIVVERGAFCLHNFNALKAAIICNVCVKKF